VNETEIDEVLWNRLHKFVRERLEEDVVLSPTTRLLADLHLDGDDAFEFMEAFAETFGVESGDFEFDRYFGPEGFNPFALVTALFRRQPAKVEVTLAMLARAITEGRWNTENIEQ
jgi:hypothetical protein